MSKKALGERRARGTKQREKKALGIREERGKK